MRDFHKLSARSAKHSIRGHWHWSRPGFPQTLYARSIPSSPGFYFWKFCWSLSRDRASQTVHERSSLEILASISVSNFYRKTLLLAFDRVIGLPTPEEIGNLKGRSGRRRYTMHSENDVRAKLELWSSRPRPASSPSLLRERPYETREKYTHKAITRFAGSEKWCNGPHRIQRISRNLGASGVTRSRLSYDPGP